MRENTNTPNIEVETLTSVAETFTYEDFDSGRVFEYLCNIKDGWEQDMEERRVVKRAEAVKFPNFKRSLAKYRKRLKEKSLPVIVENGISEFQSQELELNTGEWTADEGGVWKYGGNASSVTWACSHPIMPVQRMRSIDTGLLKYKLCYHRGYTVKAWNYVVIDASEMFSPTEIVKKLAPYGVSISGGERAKAMVDYLRDITDINYDIIPEVKSVSRMGWNEEGFSPYVGGVEFDSSATFHGILGAIHPQGDFDEWLTEAKDARTYSLTARIVLAASFASVLVEPLGTLPFFVHLWSTSSGTGKTVAQMLGASVWANPSLGSPFFPTFRSTSVGFEMMAGFLHNLPLFIDELQLAKDAKGAVKFNVYELASGSGKLRSNKSLGLNYTPTWANCFVTSGETPIVKDTDGEGAINRVIEIECHANDAAIKDGHRTANAVKNNFGWAGKLFVDKLLEDSDEDDILQSVSNKIHPVYDAFFEACTKNDTTEKQAMAAAVILTADKFATDWIFQDGNALTLDEISEFLKSKETVSMMERGYDILCDWVAINANKLHGYRDEDRGDCFGLIDGNTVYIIRSIFNRVCMENEINPSGLLSHLKTRGLIETYSGKNTIPKRLGGSSPTVRCVGLHLPSDEDSATSTDELPF